MSHCVLRAHTKMTGSADVIHSNKDRTCAPLTKTSPVLLLSHSMAVSFEWELTVLTRISLHSYLRPQESMRHIMADSLATVSCCLHPRLQNHLLLGTNET